MEATALLDAPSEILLIILSLSRVQDILCLERTCRRLRDLIATRRLWAELLENLDQVYAPDLPPHVDIATLSSSQLRKLVMDAVRVYEHCVRGLPQYIRRATVVPDTPDGSFGLQGIDVRLAPGGRYLFIKWSGGVFQILDLHKNNVCIWTHRLGHLQTFALCSPYAFEVCRDATMTVAITACDGMVGERWLGVYRLAGPEDGEHELQSNLAYSCVINAIFTRLKLENDFVVAKLRYSQDHIAGTTLLDNMVFVYSPRSQSLGGDRSVDITIVHLDMLSSIRQSLENGSSVRLQDASFDTLPFAFELNTHMLNSTIATLSRQKSRRSYSILFYGVRECTEPWLYELVGYEILYEPDEPDLGPGRLPISLVRGANPFLGEPFNTCYIQSDISQSKCGFLVEHRSLEKSERSLSKFGRDAHGDLFHAPLPDEIQSCLRKQGKFSILSVEHYSGALVFATASNVIDIWYPT